jgi:hypothetical protein
MLLALQLVFTRKQADWAPRSPLAVVGGGSQPAGTPPIGRPFAGHTAARRRHMLVVRPNTRRMRAFIDSPAERGSVPQRSRLGQRWQWEPRLVLAAGAIGAVLAVGLVLALH